MPWQKKKKDKDKDKEELVEENKPATGGGGVLASWDTKEEIPSIGKIKVKGQVTYATGGMSTNFLGFENKFKFKDFAIDVGCKAVVTSKSQICVNLLTKKISGGNGTDLSCQINGSSGKVPNLPGKARMDVCAVFKMKGKPGQKPVGKLNIFAEGGAAGQYKKVKLLSKDFK